MTYVYLLFLTILLNFNAFSKTSLDKINFDTPQKDISIIASSLGYFPSTIVVYVGDEINFYLTSAQANFIGCMVLPQLDIFLTAKIGEISQGTHTFMIPGRYKFYCPAQKFLKGNIIVLERDDDTSVRAFSENNDDYKNEWRPAIVEVVNGR